MYDSKVCRQPFTDCVKNNFVVHQFSFIKCGAASSSLLYITSKQLSLAVLKPNPPLTARRPSYRLIATPSPHNRAAILAHRAHRYPITMFSSQQKKVHYERGTKGGRSSHGHRSSGSRDSGVGSSSASDRASLGTSPKIDTAFSYLDIENQRNRLGAVQEALDAARERIQLLEAANANLNAQLTESNKENRALKRERIELLDKLSPSNNDLKDEKKRNHKSKRESSPRTGVAAPSKTERRTTPPRNESRDAESPHYEDERSRSSHTARRGSWRELPVPLYDGDRPPTAPYSPSTASSTTNPFMPNPPRPSPISVAYTPSAVYPTSPTVTYASMPSAYTTLPPLPSHSSSDRFPNDGRYHHYPL